ncbi:hypothetical protein ACFWDI_28255 [Streptomyces sp. NPDC060064]|uniref:hypothetical protein n=1 Tax=Streptomyces sp. NPDC060064 TaxID=3347049 RepID=UPI0036B188B7
MRIIEHRIGRQYQDTLDRVDEIAQSAIRLVEKHMRGSVGHVEIAVATNSGVIDMVKQAHRDLLNTKVATDRYLGRQFGTTTINESGVLVIVNAQICRGRTKEIDKTLVHELVHAAQFTKPGARDRILRSLRNNYRLEPLTRAEVRDLNRQVDQDEREAARLERLARQL